LKGLFGVMCLVWPTAAIRYLYSMKESEAVLKSPRLFMPMQTFKTQTHSLGPASKAFFYPFFFSSHNPIDTMHIKQYELATQLNSQGAVLTENGQYQEAICAFTSALEIFQQMMNECDNNDVVEQHYEPAATPFDRCMKQIVQPPPSYYEGGFIYQSPLRIFNDKLSNKKVLAATWQQTTTIDSAIVMFNLALSLHLGAVKMKLSPTRSQQLERAGRLYELAFQLHGEIKN
jgi:tetratricopeptide (TPR) repeat protein